ncbi:hypothetical protein AVEN_9048-1 [Araneus ventricosus]|uniref:Uncharacterized protein n=1 Tax=Araneus ventricosus TaxID=182803 RepID=A0A4Y2NI36_ARAVE|nr:hypothetical protein AVEN_9048-1 [Araneus ventricosus]
MVREKNIYGNRIFYPRLLNINHSSQKEPHQHQSSVRHVLPFFSQGSTMGSVYGAEQVKFPTGRNGPRMRGLGLTSCPLKTFWDGFSPRRRREGLLLRYLAELRSHYEKKRVPVKWWNSLF